jgi:hypothetical protein
MSDQNAGSFSYGRVVGQLVETLGTWRVTTSSDAVAAEVARLLGGESNPLASGSDESLEIVSEAASVRIVIADLNSIMLYGVGADGTSSTQVQRTWAKSGIGPGPDVVIRFSLAAMASLGSFKFRSRSWRFLECATAVRRSLSPAESAVQCVLTLDAVKFEGVRGISTSYWAPGLARV